MHSALYVPVVIMIVCYNSILKQLWGYCSCMKFHLHQSEVKQEAHPDQSQPYILIVLNNCIFIHVCLRMDSASIIITTAMRSPTNQENLNCHVWQERSAAANKSICVCHSHSSCMIQNCFSRNNKPHRFTFHCLLQKSIQMKPLKIHGAKVGVSASDIRSGRENHDLASQMYGTWISIRRSSPIRV